MCWPRINLASYEDEQYIIPERRIIIIRNCYNYSLPASYFSSGRAMETVFIFNGANGKMHSLFG
jgi:hypothetical protein